jgi:hypothetical protein
MTDKLLSDLQEQYKKLQESFLVGDRVRTLFKENENPHSLKRAIASLARLLPDGWVLVGGLSVGFHATPRGTDDVDIMIYSESKLSDVKDTLKHEFADIPNRKHAMRHKETKVELEILTPEFLKIDTRIIKKAIDDAIVVDHMRIVSKEGLVATKLCRGEFKDLGDIEVLVKAHGVIDVSGYPLTDKQLALYKTVTDSIAQREVPQADVES